MPEDSNNEEVRKRMDEISGDILRIFYMNLVLIGLYTSAMALIYRGEGANVVHRVLGSTYTIFGFTAWTGAMVGSVTIYHRARRQSIEQMSDIISLPSNSLDFVVAGTTAAAITTFLTVFSLLIGLMDGVAEGGIPLKSPVGVLVIAWAIPFTVVLTLVYGFDQFTEKIAPYRKGARDWFNRKVGLDDEQ